MSVIRLIFVTVPEDKIGEAERNWKEDCAPLMIRQPGCISEQLLRCADNPGEFISYSEWEDENAIRRYLASADHQEIKRHNTKLKNVSVAVKSYFRVG